RAARDRLAIEDLLLFAWAAVAQPVLFTDSAAPSDDLFLGRDDPLLGALYVFACAGAVVALLTRDADTSSQAASLGPEDEAPVAGPMAAGILIVFAAGLDLFGAALPDWPIVVVFGAAFGGIFLRRRLPPLTGVARRALVAPYVMAAAGIFDQATSTTDRLLDLRLVAELRSSDDIGIVLVVAGIGVAVSAFYYAMLIFAPRRLAGDTASSATWVIRYLVFLASVIVGVTVSGLLNR
ncbi:MAG: hypothetical protein M3295_06165, partial [Chloroflexota bacterium]|nr:hypothetical protein [Chloroflexota bacterium]